MKVSLKPIKVVVRSSLEVEPAIIRKFMLTELREWVKRNYPDMEFEIQ